MVIELEVNGELHPEAAYSYEAIGNVYKNMDQIDMAETQYLASYEIQLDALREEDNETVSSIEKDS